MEVLRAAVSIGWANAHSRSGWDPSSWQFAPVRPQFVTTVNLQKLESSSPNIRAIQGDACNLPPQVTNQHYDLVFSNSVIEHLGGHIQRQCFAGYVHELADRHWIQTPYRYFPIEPHWLFPGMQWLPYEARTLVSMHWNRGHVRTYSREEAQSQVNEIDLLGISQMRHYFPSSDIWFERVAGLVKSLVAIRD